MLIGRESELRVVESLLAGARVAQSGVLVVSGEAGIGKTALLDEVAAGAAGMRVLRATGSEPEREVPFGALLQLLGPALHLLDRIPAPRAEALSVALALRSGRAGDRFAVGAATLSLLCRLAEERPLAVLVDDAHLVDRPSAEALLFAARRLLADPVVLLVATRPEGGVLGPDAGLRHLPLGGVDLSAATALLRAQTGGPVRADVAARLHEATGGNPLALLELAGEVDRLDRRPPDLPIGAPAGVSRAFSRRTQALAEQPRRALLVAAASGGDLAVTAGACRLLGVDLESLVAAERADLVRVTDERVEFRHPLLRATVYADAAPEDRRAAHAAVAATLPHADVERRAWHRAEATLGVDEAAADLLAQAGTSARQRGAEAVASIAFERAARLTPGIAERVPRLVAAGDAAFLAGQGERADHLLAEALTLAPDRLTAARIRGVRGTVAARRGSLEDACRLLLDAAAELAGTDPDAAVVLLSDAVNACFYLGDAGSAGTAASVIDGLLSSTTDRVARILGTMATGMALVLAGGAGTAQIREAVEMLEPGDLPRDPRRAAWWVMGALWLRDSGPARRLVDDVVDELRERAAIGTLPFLLSHVARDDATTDRLGRARAGYLEAIRLARETGQTTDLAMSLAGLAWLEARTGQEDDCREHATEALRVCTAHSLHLPRTWALSALGEAQLAAGRPAAALPHYEELMRLLDEIGVGDPDVSPAPELADALLRVGRPAEARVVARRYCDRAAAKGQPWALARAERAAGMTGPDDELDRHFLSALELHARTPDVFEEARTRLAYGSRLRRARRRVEARPQLRSAVASFERLRAAPWADHAAAELAATGETAHRRDVSAIDELTPQELQVAMMLAGGRTTRQAAAALFLSPKTVEYHLRHVYTKLGVRSREELARTIRDPVS